MPIETNGKTPTDFNWPYPCLISMAGPPLSGTAKRHLNQKQKRGRENRRNPEHTELPDLMGINVRMDLIPCHWEIPVAREEDFEFKKKNLQH